MTKFTKVMPFDALVSDPLPDKLIRSANTYARSRGVDQTPVAFMNGASVDSTEPNEVCNQWPISY